ncbi:AAA family ATPase [Maridesulfovibrio sp.]|uniref:AAA family ATPase n=1 Tax=Maridesulfovibrio sp. TaxID=2795000 RepID=UPI0039EF4FB5
MNNLIVFTGGPGSGKTTTINHLIGMGYRSMAEVGRQVIQEQLKIGGKALPWDDKIAFRDEMVRKEVDNYNCQKCTDKLIFCDRSIIDSYGYSLLEGLPISDELLGYCNQLKYHPKIFIFPPWKSIFENDDERKQDFDEAVATYQEMVSAYNKFEYSLVKVPKKSVEERVDFILEHINND